MAKKSYKNKNVIITGGASGIGLAMAKQFLQREANLCLTDINEDRLNQSVADLSLQFPGAKIDHHVVDHTSEKMSVGFCETFLAKHGQVDVLCANAGVGAGGNTEEQSLKDWKWVIDTNIWGSIYVIYGLLPAMRQQGSGTILITASMAGLVPMPGMAAYCASKFAMVGLAESLRLELDDQKIHVSALCPGIINTNIVADGKIASANDPGKQQSVVEFYQKFGATADSVAKDALSGLDRNQAIIVSPSSNESLSILKRFSPGLYSFAARGFWKVFNK